MQQVVDAVFGTRKNEKFRKRTLGLETLESRELLSAVSVSSGQDSIEEGQSGYIQIQRDDTSTEETIFYELDWRNGSGSNGSEPGWAADGVDFDCLANLGGDYGYVTFTVGQQNANIDINVFSDQLAEGTEQLYVSLPSYDSIGRDYIDTLCDYDYGDGYTINPNASSVTISILDNTAAAAADAGDTLATAMGIVFNNNVFNYTDIIGNGFYGYLDVDIYQLTVSSGDIGREYVFETSLPNSSNASPVDTYLYLFNSSGSQLTYDDDGGNGLYSRLTFTPAEAGTYYLGVSSYGNRYYSPTFASSGSGGGTGDYTLTVTVNGGENTNGGNTGNEDTGDDELSYVSLNISNDQYTVLHNTVMSVSASYGLLSNDYNPGIAGVSIVANSLPLYGQLQLSPNGAFVYTPDDGFVGQDCFTYRLAETNGNISDVAMVIIDVTNSEATGSFPTFSFVHDSSPSFYYYTNLLYYWNDADGDELSIPEFTNAQHGTVNVSSDGYFTYTPDEHFIGSDFFHVKIVDSTGAGTLHLVPITVSNSTPIAHNDYYVTAVGGVLQIDYGGILNNDSDYDGDSFSVVQSSQTQNGTLTLNPNGTFTYVPNAGFSGVDSFTYEITDGIDKGVAVAFINVSAEQNPAAIDDSFTLTAGSSYNGSVRWNDNYYAVYPMGDIEFEAADPHHGTLTFSTDGQFIYTPDAGFTGEDSFTYKITGYFGESNTALVLLHVSNQLPRVIDGTYYTYANTTLTEGDNNSSKQGVLSNGIDYDWGQDIIVDWHGQPSHGTVSVSFNGSFEYIPDTNFVGTDHFVYHVSDSYSEGVYGDVTIYVTNHVPTANDDNHWLYSRTSDGSAYEPYEFNVLSNDYDYEYQPLTVTILAEPTHGTLTANAESGSYTYTPDPLFTGIDVFIYYVSDGIAASNTARVTLNVSPAQATARFDEYTVEYGHKLTVSPSYENIYQDERTTYVMSSLFSNDTTNEQFSLDTLQIVKQPAYGTVELEVDEDGQYTGGFTYTPNNTSLTPGQGEPILIDGFSYQFGEGDLTSNVASVKIAIQFQKPAAKNDAYTLQNLVGTESGAYGAANSGIRGPYTVPISSGVLANDSGNWSSYSYFSSWNSFSSLSASAQELLFNTWIQGDITGSIRHFVVAGTMTTEEGGTVILNSGGGFTYTPPAVSGEEGFYGLDSFEYQTSYYLCLPNAEPLRIGTKSQKTTVTLDLRVTEPVARDDFYVMPPNLDTLEIGINEGLISHYYGYYGYYGYYSYYGYYGAYGGENDSDLNGMELQIYQPGPVSTDGSEGHSLTVHADGSFEFTPSSETFAGEVTFEYRVTNGIRISDPVKVTLLVENHSPTVYYTPRLTVSPETEYSGSLPVSDDGRGTLTYTVTGYKPSWVSINPDGTYHFTPPAGFDGAIEIPYSVSDGVAGHRIAEGQLCISANSYYSGYYLYADLIYESYDRCGYYYGYDSESDWIFYPLNGNVLYNASTNGGDVNVEWNSSNINEDSDVIFTASSDGNYSIQVKDTASSGLIHKSFSYTIHATAPNGTPLEIDSTLHVEILPVPSLPKRTTLYTAQYISDPDTQSVYFKLDDAFANSYYNYYNNYYYYGYYYGYPWQDTETYSYEWDTSGTSSWLDLENSHFNADGTFDLRSLDTLSHQDNIYDIPYTVRKNTTDVVVEEGVVRVHLRTTLAVAADDEYTVLHDNPLLVPWDNGLFINDTDIDIGNLSASVISTPAHAERFEFDEHGGFLYVPVAGFVGWDSFEYKLNPDSSYVGKGYSARVNIHVTDTPGTAKNDYYEIEHDQKLFVSYKEGVLLQESSNYGYVYGGDVDPDEGDMGIAQMEIVGNGPEHGILTTNALGGFCYEPEAGYTGIDTFYYRFGTSQTKSNVAAVSIRVKNTLPQPQNDQYFLPDASGTVFYRNYEEGVLANDTLRDNEIPTVLLKSSNAQGTLDLRPSGAFIYTPLAGFHGTDYFVYTISDGIEESIQAVISFTVDNAQPAAVSDRYETSKNCALTIAANEGVLLNDYDENGDILTWSVLTQPTHGTLLGTSQNGGFHYLPDENFVGEDFFTYQVNDPYGGTAAGVVRINITGEKATASKHTYTTEYNRTLVVSRLDGLLISQNGTEGNGASEYHLTVQVLDQPEHGILSLSSSGMFTYTPEEDYIGEDMFTFQTYKDGIPGAVSSAVISVTAPSAATAVNDVYSLLHNEDLILNVDEGLLANDQLAETGLVEIIIVNQPLHGTVSVNQNGSFRYAPSQGFAGNDLFTYKIKKGETYSNIASVSLSITNTVDAAQEKSYMTHSEESLWMSVWDGVIGYTHDSEGDLLTVTLLQDVRHGELILYENGAFGYIPDEGFFGEDSFYYQLADSITAGGMAKVTIYVENTAPVVLNDTYEVWAVNEERYYQVSASEIQFGTVNDGVMDNSVLIRPAWNGILANDTDADFDDLTALLVNTPLNGTLTLDANGGFHYVPNAGFVGTDMFTYRVSDGHSTSGIASVEIIVKETLPHSVNDTYTALQNEVLFIPLEQSVLKNDFDRTYSRLAAEILTQPSHGTLLWNEQGVFTYIPTQDYIGDDSFTYRAGKSAATGSAATVTIHVLSLDDAAISPVTVQNDSYEVSHNGVLVAEKRNVLSNDSYWGNDERFAVLEDTPQHGTLVFFSDGTFRYTPFAFYQGIDTFTYRVHCGELISDSATVTITVINTAPVVTDDSYSTHAGTALFVDAENGVLLNDTDDENDFLTASVYTQPQHGTLTLFSGGAFTYLPTAGYTGNDSFQYIVNGSVIGTVSISVENSAPTGNYHSYSTLHDKTLRVEASAGVLENAADADNDTLSCEVYETTSHGQLTLYADGTFVYKPDNAYAGSDSFTYRIWDGTDWSAEQTVYLNVTNTNDPIQNLYYSVKHDTALMVFSSEGLIPNRVDADGDYLSVLVPSYGMPQYGELEYFANGSFIYTPNADYAGYDSFVYRITDGVDSNGDGIPDYQEQTVSIYVENTLPYIPYNTFYSVEHNKNLIVYADNGILKYAADSNGETFTIALSNEPQHGTVTLGYDGAFIYQPEDDFTGQDTFTVAVTNGVDANQDGTPDYQTAVITIDVIHPQIWANNDYYSISMGQSLLVAESAEFDNLWEQAVYHNLPGANDYHYGDGALQYQLVSAPSQGGTVIMKETGVFGFIPDQYFSGSYTFTYEVSNGFESDTADITIYVSDSYIYPQNDSYSLSTDYYTADGNTYYSPSYYGYYNGETLNIINASEFTSGLLANDYLSNGGVSGLKFDPNRYEVSVDTLPFEGKGEFKSNTYGGFLFIPNDTVNETITFTYTVRDKITDTTVEGSATIYAYNILPVTNNDEFYSYYKTPASANGSYTARVSIASLLENDFDYESNSLSFAGLAYCPDNVTVSGGEIVYTLPAGYESGSVAVTYKVTDSIHDDSEYSTGTLTITILNDRITVKEYNAEAARKKQDSIALNNHIKRLIQAGRTREIAEGGIFDLQTTLETAIDAATLTMFNALAEEQAGLLELYLNSENTRILLKEQKEAETLAQYQAAELTYTIAAFQASSALNAAERGAEQQYRTTEENETAAYLRQLAALDATHRAGLIIQENQLSEELDEHADTQMEANDTARQEHTQRLNEAEEDYASTLTALTLQRNTAIANAEVAFHNASDTAKTTRNTAVASASAAYQTAVNSASSERNAALSDAQTAYQNAAAAAEAIYAQQTPDAETTDSIQLMNNADYRAAVEEAFEEYCTLVEALEEDYWDAMRMANSDYEDALIAAKSAYNSSYGAASSTFNSAVNTAKTAFNNAQQAAVSAQNTKIAYADGVYYTTVQNASAVYSTSVFAAYTTYDQQRYNANSAYTTSVENAVNTKIDRVYDAEIDYNNTMDPFDSAYRSAAREALRNYETGVHSANTIFDNATLAADIAFRSAEVTHSNTLLVNMLTAFTTRDGQFREQNQTLITAKKTAWNTLQATCWAAENTYIGTINTAMQSIRSNNALQTYSVSAAMYGVNAALAEAKREHGREADDAEYVEAKVQYLIDKAKIIKNKTPEFSALQKEKEQEILDAEHTFAFTRADAMRNYDIAVANSSYTYTEAAIYAQEIYDKAFAEHSETYLDSMNEAMQTYSLALITASNQWQSGAENSLAKHLLDYQLSISAAAKDWLEGENGARTECDTAINEAHTDLPLAVKDAYTLWKNSVAAADAASEMSVLLASFALNTAINPAREEWATAIGTANTEFEEDISAAANDYATAANNAVTTHNSNLLAATQDWTESVSEAKSDWLEANLSAVGQSIESATDAWLEWLGDVNALRTAAFSEWNNIQETAYSQKEYAAAAAQEVFSNAKAAAIADEKLALLPYQQTMREEILDAENDYVDNITDAWVTQNTSVTAARTSWNSSAADAANTYYEEVSESSATLLTGRMTNQTLKNTEDQVSLLAYQVGVQPLNTSWQSNENEASEQYQQELASADETRYAAIIGATAVYKNTMSQAGYVYENVLANYDRTVGAELSDADSVWASAVWTDYTDYLKSISSISTEYSETVINATTAYTVAVAALDKTLAIARANSDRTYAEDLADNVKTYGNTKANCKEKRANRDAFQAYKAELAFGNNGSKSIDEKRSHTAQVSPTAFNSTTWVGYWVRNISEGTLKDVVWDSAVGVADSITGNGVSNMLRWNGLQNWTDTSSSAYTAGVIGGTMISVTLSFGAGASCSAVSTFVKVIGIMDSIGGVSNLAYKVSTGQQITAGDCFSVATSSAVWFGIGRAVKKLNGWQCFTVDTLVITEDTLPTEQFEPVYAGFDWTTHIVLGVAATAIIGWQFNDIRRKKEEEKQKLLPPMMNKKRQTATEKLFESDNVLDDLLGVSDDAADSPLLLCNAEKHINVQYQFRSTQEKYDSLPKRGMFSRIVTTLLLLALLWGGFFAWQYRRANTLPLTQVSHQKTSQLQAKRIGDITLGDRVLGKNPVLSA
ncbi:MAG: tandem-95 repeat protein, partial [Planctomycetaceae bacterium]|nr:tandem-95 repeat protein [Planctomycetaceae bacterium]